MAKIYLNEDNSHYFYSRKEKSANRDEIENFINQYKDSNVEVLLLCPNSQITSFKSDVWDCLADRIDDYQEYFIKTPNMSDWVYAVQSLIEQGIDIYQEFIDLLRKINIKPYISVRMNDVHNADDENDILHSNFYKEHLDYRRALYRDRNWEDRELNYLIKEVRDYHMLLINEYFERYDIDGIEIDWMRFGNHFPTGYADEGRLVLNEFMREVRKKADEYEVIRGHKIAIGARCPVKPETAFDLGMDAIYWAKNGYIDFLVPTPFWHSSQGDIPIEMWKYLLDGTDCLLIPGYEICLRPNIVEIYNYKDSINSLETVTGPACSYIDRGADALYFFNYMDRQYTMYDDDTYHNFINKVGDYDQMKKRMKRYVVTFNDRKPDGLWLDAMLPKKLKKDQFIEYRVHTGNMADKEEQYIISSFTNEEQITTSDITVYINGHPCDFVGDYTCKKPYPDTKMYQWKVPTCAIKNGYQVIEYVAATDKLCLNWVEMVVY